MDRCLTSQTSHFRSDVSLLLNRLFLAFFPHFFFEIGHLRRPTSNPNIECPVPSDFHSRAQMFITTFSPSVKIGRLQHTTSLDKIVFGRNRTTQTSNFRSDVLALPNRLFPPFFEHFFEIRFARLFSKLDFNDIRSQTTH